MYIYKPAPQKKYSVGEKLSDLLSILDSKSINRTVSVTKQIEQKLSANERFTLRYRDLKLNGYDEHIFLASQQNRGILTPEAISKYAKKEFKKPEQREAFLEYTGVRLGYLQYMGLLNDISKSEKFNSRAVTKESSGGPIKQEVQVRVDYRFEVNRRFFDKLSEFRHHKGIEIKKSFEFSRFDAWIFNQCRKSLGKLDVEEIRQKNLQEAGNCRDDHQAK